MRRDLVTFGHRSQIWTRGDTTFVLVSPPDGERSTRRRHQYVMKEAHALEDEHVRDATNPTQADRSTDVAEADGGRDAAPSRRGAARGAAAEPRLSRKAAWLAMGAVALALALIWMAPGIDHVDETAGRR